MKIPEVTVDVQDGVVVAKGVRPYARVGYVLYENAHVSGAFLAADNLWAERHPALAHHPVLRPSMLLDTISATSREDILRLWDLPVEEVDLARESFDLIRETLDKIINGDGITPPAMYLVTADGGRYTIEPSSDFSVVEDLTRRLHPAQSVVRTIRSHYESRLRTLAKALNGSAPPMIPKGQVNPFENPCTLYQIDGGRVVALLPISITAKYSTRNNRTFRAPDDLIFTLKGTLEIRLRHEGAGQFIATDVLLHSPSGEEITTPHASSHDSCLGEMDLPRNIQTIADIVSLRDRIAALLGTVNTDSPLYRYPQGSMDDRWEPFFYPRDYGFIEVKNAYWGERLSEWEAEYDDEDEELENEEDEEFVDEEDEEDEAVEIDPSAFAVDNYNPQVVTWDYTHHPPRDML